MVTPNRNVFKFATLALIWILAITSLITKTSRNKLRLLENYSESLKPNFKKSELDLIIGIKHKVHPPPNLTKVKVISEIDAFITNAKQTKSSRYFFFLKTHKTASSTIQNLMLRYADFHRLNLVIPTFPNDPARFHYPLRAYLENQSIQPKDVYPRKNELTGENNILCHHTRFSKNIYDFLYTEDKLKSAPVFKFTVVRSPVSLFQSSFAYFKNVGYKGFKDAGSVERFIDAPEKFYNEEEFLSQFGHNHMMFDLGYSANNVEGPVLQKQIQEIDDSFDLVLLTDYFDESMVLLKEQANLTILDVMALRTNSRKKDTKPAKPSKNELSIQTIAGILSWNRADAELYEFFKNKLFQKIEKFGKKRMDREVSVMREYREIIESLCTNGKKSAKEQGNVIMQYVLRRDKRLTENVLEYCEALVAEELPYSKTLFLRQVPDWKGW